MKKSKFLKKSLAMLLALMLVVAMIPLSASADTPLLRRVDVHAGGQVVQTTAGEAANTYVGEIPNLSEDITLEVLTGSGNQVFYTRETSTATEDVPATLFDGEVQWTFTIPAGDVSNYEIENGDIEIHFTVADKDRPGTRLQYTVLLTPVYVSTDLGIEKFTLNSVVGENVQLGETVIGANDIYFTVPYDTWQYNGTYPIRELELASATATVTFSRQNATTGELEYYYTTEAATDKVVTAGRPNIQIMDEDQMTIENNDNSKTYTLHITTAPGFTSFTTAEALDSARFVEDGKIAVLLPYGYGYDYTGTVDVTPVFDLDYDSAWVTVDGTVIDGVDDTITIDETLINYGAPGSGNSCFGTYLGETDTDWTGRDRSSWDVFKTGGIDDDECIEFTVHYSEEASRTYEVYFMEPNENSEALITEFSIGSEDAVINQEAGTIDITVPMGTDVSELNAALDGTIISHSDVDLVASNNATITVPMQDSRNGTTVTEDGGNKNAANDRQRFVDFDMTGTLDATNAVDIRVVSEDGLTENWYELNVTVADEFVDPAITDISIQSPDGSITIKGTPTVDEKTGRSVILFEELPYSVYDRGELENWKLFYTKTIGATITYDSNGTAEGGTAIALPKSGSVIGSYTNAPYIPDPNDKDIEGNVAIDLRVDGDELSGVVQSYTIMLTRGEGNYDSSLKDFDLYGVPDFASYDGTWNSNDVDDYHSTANLTSRYIYEGVVDTQDGPGSTITVNVPWSVYEQWEDNEAFGALVEAAEDSNARVYVVVEKADGTENLHPIYDYTASNATSVYKTTGNQDRTVYDESTIVVLSERAWVSMMEDELYATATGWTDVIDDWDDIKADIGNGVAGTEDYAYYTEYALDIAEADPTLGNTFEEEPRLVDGTGWTAALEIDADGSVARIEGTIPYALTSDFNDPKTWNPVYLEYGVDDWAFVMGDDITLGGSNNGKVSLDDNGIPTAGSDRDGVFIDIADYLEMYVNEDGSQNYDLALAHYYSDGNPFFLIGRDGTVRIYNYTGNGQFVTILDRTNTVRNTALADDRLVVSSESGTNVGHYTFDLKVAPANKEAVLSSFWFEEYPTRKGIIDEATKTITVTLPYGTEYTYLTPNYEVSSGAIVTIDDPELQGKPLFPGYTDVNFSTSRKVTVIPENEDGNTEYTVRVQIEEQFSDVSEGDWFYDNVMDAAANGYVNGYTDGTFGPTKDITRAEFAAMVANAFGYETNNDVDPAFKDVEQGHWANGAIAFCAERGYINGYTDGTFQPNKTISRQEAASILKNTFNLTGNTGDLFPDDSAIASWAKDNVYAVKHSGLMKGDAGTGNFRPTATITRAEAASIFMNANRAGLIK